MVVFLWRCLCGGVCVVVVFLWRCLCGGVCVVVMFNRRQLCSSHQNKGSINQGCHQNHSIGTCSVDLYILYFFETSGTALCGTTGSYSLYKVRS